MNIRKSHVAQLKPSSECLCSAKLICVLFFYLSAITYFSRWRSGQLTEFEVLMAKWVGRKLLAGWLS